MRYRRVTILGGSGFIGRYIVKRLARRGAIVTGLGGKQGIVDDPSGNPIELFEPTVAEARLGPRS